MNMKTQRLYHKFQYALTLYIIEMFCLLLYPSINIVSKIAVFPHMTINGSINLSNCSIILMKEYLHWTKLKTSYYQRIPTKAGFIVQIFSSAIARELCRLVHLNNVYCNADKIIAKGNKQIVIYTEKKVMNFSTKNLQHYENIIYLFSEWGNVFAHFIHDCLPQLILIPKDIIEKSMIMISFNIDIAMQYFELLNIQSSKILYDKKLWYYTENLYMCYSIEPHNGFNMYSFPKIVKILRTKLNISEVQAYRYIFLNRNKGEKRYIENMDEFYVCTQNQIPYVQWEFEQLNYTSLIHIANVFSTVKLLVTPSGSHTIYMIFMNRNYSVGICLIQSDWIDLPNYISAYNNEIWMNGFCHTWQHHDCSPHNCSIDTGIQMINNLYHAIMNNKWDNNIDPNMREAFDFKTIEKLAKKNYNETQAMYMRNNTIFYYTMDVGWK